MKISDWHQEACLIMPNSVVWNGFYYPILTQIVDSLSYSSLNTSFYIEKKKHGKMLAENPEYAEMQHTCDMVKSL